MKIAKQAAVKQRYDTTACDMPSIIQGQTVRVLLHPNNPTSTWVLGICIDQLSDRSYILLVKGKKYHCNRKVIRPMPEQLKVTLPADHPTVNDDYWGTGEFSESTAQQITNKEATVPPTVPVHTQEPGPTSKCLLDTLQTVM